MEKLTAKEIKRNTEASGYSARELAGLARYEAVRLVGEGWVRAAEEEIPEPDNLPDCPDNLSFFRAAVNAGDGIWIFACYLIPTELDADGIPIEIWDFSPYTPAWYEVVVMF